MRYTMCYSSYNKGLIVFLIDQSASMSAFASNGLSLAEIAANNINLVINDIILGLCYNTGDVRNFVTIAAIGYGGKDSSNSELLFCESINKIDESLFPRVPMVIATNDENSTLPCIQVIKPVANYGTPMANAFKMAKDIVAAWINTHNDVNDPVPVVINVSGGYPTDSETDVRKYANDIMNMSVPDGNVLLYNIHISRKLNCPIMFPADGEIMPDKISQLLYDISSKASQDLIDIDYLRRYINIQSGCRLFLSGIDHILFKHFHFYEMLDGDRIFPFKIIKY